MSDYVYKKAIRMKVTDELLEKFNVEDSFDFVDALYNEFYKDNEKYQKMKELGKHSYIKKEFNYFESELDEDNCYIDFILDYSYGEYSHDFGSVRKLLDDEYLEYSKVFNDFLCYDNNHMPKLCLVEYCYYNCSESDTYYEEYDYSNLKWNLRNKDMDPFENAESFDDDELLILNKIFQNPNLYQFTVDNDHISVRELNDGDFDSSVELSEEEYDKYFYHSFDTFPEEFLVKLINFMNGHAERA